MESSENSFGIVQKVRLGLESDFASADWILDRIWKTFSDQEETEDTPVPVNTVPTQRPTVWEESWKFNPVNSKCV